MRSRGGGVLYSNTYRHDSNPTAVVPLGVPVLPPVSWVVRQPLS